MIKEQEAGLTVAEVCRKHGISPASFYKLKAKYEPPRFYRRPISPCYATISNVFKFA